MADNTLGAEGWTRAHSRWGGRLRSWSRKAEGPRWGPAMSSAGLAQGSRGCCPEKPAPPWPRALPSAPPEPLGSAWALGGARSPHRPSPLAPITLLCVHVSGMEKGPGLEDGPLLPHPGEGTSRSWNVKGNNSVQGGGRRARRVWARRDGALWWPGAELRSPAPPAQAGPGGGGKCPHLSAGTFRSIWQLQGQGPQTNGTSRGLGEEGAIRWLEPWGLGLPPGQGWGGLCIGAEGVLWRSPVTEARRRAPRGT